MNSEPRFKSESYRPILGKCCYREGPHHCDSADANDSARPCWGIVDTDTNDGGFSTHICRGHQEYCEGGEWEYKTEPGFVAPSGLLQSYHIKGLVFPPDMTVDKADSWFAESEKQYNKMRCIYSELLNKIHERQIHHLTQ